MLPCCKLIYRDWKISRISASCHVCIAGVIECDTVAYIRQCPADESGINQPGSSWVQLRDEHVVAALIGSEGNREVSRKCRTGDVSVTAGIDRNAGGGVGICPR